MADLDAIERDWKEVEPIGYLSVSELSRLRSGHDARLRSAKFGPSYLDGDVPVFLVSVELRAGEWRKEAARTPRALERSVRGWVSVSEGLPGWASRDDTSCFIDGREIGATLTSEKVLVAIAPNNVVRIDNLVSIEGAEHGWFDTYGKRVTHWMTLPEAPDPVPPTKEPENG